MCRPYVGDCAFVYDVLYSNVCSYAGVLQSFCCGLGTMQCLPLYILAPFAAKVYCYRDVIM